MRIVWSKFAENQLDEIFNYYSKKAGLRIANKLLKGIICEPNKLLNAIDIGQEEEFLKNRGDLYRYLVFKNYKIIYSIDNKNRLIKIADVFDTRQYPDKIKRT